MAENLSNHVFVDLDVERPGDLLGDSRAAPVGVLLHFERRLEFWRSTGIGWHRKALNPVGNGVLEKSLRSAVTFLSGLPFMLV